MRFNKRPVLQVVIPSTAADGDDRIVIGLEPLPDELQDYYTPFLGTVVGGFLYYLADGSYLYDIMISYTGWSGLARDSGIWNGTSVTVFQSQYYDPTQVDPMYVTTEVPSFAQGLATFYAGAELYGAGALIGGTGAQISGDLTFADSSAYISMGRGRRYFMASSAATGAIGSASFVSALSSTSDWICRAGRAYKVSIGGGGLSTSLGTNVAEFVLNKIVAGVETNMIDFGWIGPQVGAFPQNVSASAIIKNSTASNVTVTDVILYMKASAGTVNWLVAPGTMATIPRWLEIRDIGAATNYASALSI